MLGGCFPGLIWIPWSLNNVGGKPSIVSDAGKFLQQGQYFSSYRVVCCFIKGHLPKLHQEPLFSTLYRTQSSKKLGSLIVLDFPHLSPFKSSLMISFNQFMWFLYLWASCIKCLKQTFRLLVSGPTLLSRLMTHEYLFHMTPVDCSITFIHLVF